MDEDALRAMMPMGFGKQSRKPQPQQQQPRKQGKPDFLTPSSSSSSSARNMGNPYPSLSSTSAPIKGTSSSSRDVRAAHDDDDDDDDGLTPEERKANEEAEKRAIRKDAKGDDDDEEGDEDSDGSVDLGPEPSNGDGIDRSISTFPMSCEALLEDHNKTVSALALDPSGARVATGSFDYDLKLWDFGGMTSTFRPFRSFEPAGNYPIHDLGFSHSGEHLLCISGTSQAKVFDRDGTELATYKKGDVYIRDMKNTSGHVAELSCGSWHPQERGTFMTASADSTVRFWDVDDKTKQKTVIVVKSKERGTRTKVTAATLSHDGRTLAAAGLDGALHLWDTRSNYARPRHSVDTAHQRNTETSCIAFSRDSHTLVTRGGSGDDTVKLWDSRNFKRPLAEKGGLPNASAQTDVIFSLDEKSILTGVAAESRIDPSGVKRKTIKDGSDRDEENEDEDPEKNRGGRIAVLSRLDLEQTHSFSISPSSVTRLRWHPKINQIFASTKKGQVHVFYDPTSSSRGALLCVGKRPKPRNPFNVDMSLYETGGGDVMIPSAEIITPGARSSTSNDLHQSQAAKKRKLEKMRQDPKASRMPQRPIQGPGKGGRIGAAATQHLVQSIWKDNSRDEDPREALLKYADEKAKGGTKWTAAWDKNQPITIYSKEEEEEAVEGTQESGGAEGGEE